VLSYYTPLSKWNHVNNVNYISIIIPLLNRQRSNHSVTFWRIHFYSNHLSYTRRMKKTSGPLVQFDQISVLVFKFENDRWYVNGPLVSVTSGSRKLVFPAALIVKRSLPPPDQKISMHCCVAKSRIYPAIFWTACWCGFPTTLIIIISHFVLPLIASDITPSWTTTSYRTHLLVFATSLANQLCSLTPVARTTSKPRSFSWIFCASHSLPKVW
jgi:hypothetical protein